MANGLQTTSPEPKTKNLYDFLSAEGYDLGDFGTFDTKLQDAKLRKQFYIHFRGQGYDLGPLQDFEAKVKKIPTDQPSVPTGFVSPKPLSKIEQVVSDIDKYIGEQVLAPTVLKAKRFLGGKLTPEQEKKAAEVGASIAPLSKLAPSAEVIEKLPGPYKFLAATGKGSLELAEGLGTAENIAIGTALGGAPKAIQALGSAGFAGLMASSLPELWNEFKAAPTEAEKIRIATHAIGTLVFTGAAAKHAVKGGKGAIEEYQIGKAQKKALPELEKAGQTAQEITQAAEAPKISGRAELARASKTAEEIAATAETQKVQEQLKQTQAKIEQENIANLETPDLQLQTLAEQLAVDKLEKPYSELSRPEKNQIDNLSGAEYTKRLRQIAKGLQVKNPDLRKKEARPELEQQAAEILRQQLVDEKSARQPQAPKTVGPEARSAVSEETLGAPPTRPEIENKKIAERRALQNDWEARKTEAGTYTEEGFKVTPREVYEQTTGGQWSDELAKEFEAWRKDNGTEYELGDAEVFANKKQQQVIGEKPKVAKLETPDEIGLAQQRRLDQLNAIGASEDQIANDPVLKALNSRDQQIQEEGLAKFKEAQGETALDLGEIDKAFARTFGETLAETVPTARVEPGVETPKTPEQQLKERKQKVTEERQALVERKLEFAKQQQVEKERLAAERRAEQEQKRREALKKKLGEKFGEEKVTLSKEKPKAEAKIEKEAPITAETKPATGTEQTEGRPPTGEKAIMEEGQPVAARPPVNPEIAKLRPSEQHRRAQKIVDKIPKTEGWQDRAKAELEAEGYPDNIVKFFSEPERRTRPEEPFGRSIATTREGRVERASEPPPELKAAVDATADAGRRNQIAQARYEAGRKELLAELQKLEKEGVIVKFDDQTGGMQITIKNPQALTASTKAAIDRIKQAEIDKGSYKPEMVSTDLQIAVAPGAEVLKGTELKGTLAEKVLETIKRKDQAKRTQIVFDKLKAANKNALVDYYFNRNAPEQGTALLGRTKEGLPAEVLIRRAPSVKGAGAISTEAQKAIKTAKEVDRTQIDTGLSLLENAPSREAWNDQMIAKLGKQIEPKLNEIHDAIKYIQDNKFVEIRNISQALPEKAAKKGFEFIRTKLSAEDQAKFDTNLDNIKATDVEMLSRANDLGSVLAATAKQYGNYAEFGYWTLKALGRAGANKAAWAAEMVKGLGEKVRPFLDDLWKKINAEGYKPGQEYTEADLPKFNASTVKPKVEKTREDLPDDKPLPVVKDAKRPLPFVGAYVEPVIRTVERISPKVATGFRQAIDHWERQEGKGNSFILPLARALRFRPTALNRLDEISRTDGASMWDNWNEWLVKPEKMPADLTPVEKQAIGIYHKLLDERIKVLTEAGRENVEQVAFKRVPSFDLLDAIRSESGTVWNTLVKELARLNDLPTEKVEGLLKRYRLEKFGEFPTHIKIGEGKFSDTVPVLATQGLSALRALNRDTARLSGVTKVFGDNYNSTFKEIRKGLPANFQGDFDLARDAYFGVRRLDNARSMGKRLLLNLAQPIVRTALLARAAFYQPTQALAATRLTTGATFLRGLMDLAQKGTKSELEAIGAYAPAILDLAVQKGQRIEDFGRIASELGSNVSLLKPAIEITDLGITAAFRRFALDIKERGGKLLPREKNTLEVLNFTPEQIKLINEKGLAGHKDADVLYSAIINRGRKAVTFTGLKGPERTKFQLNPLISSLIQFQGFNIGQMQQAAATAKNLKTVWQRIGQAKTIEEKKAAQAQMASATKQALMLFGATATAAEANLLMKALINGQDPDRPEDAQRLFEDLTETGWLPFLREFSYGFAAEPGKVVLPLSVADELTDAWFARGKYKDYTAFERAAMLTDRYATKPYSQAYNLPKNVLIATGLAEGNPVLKTANNYYWNMLRDEGLFKESERQGYNEIQAGMREIVKIVKESEYGVPSSKIMTRIREKLIETVRAKRDELIEQKRLEPTKATVEATKRLRQSLLARRTVTKLFDEKIGKFKLGDKYFNRDELGEKLRGEKYLDMLLNYDRLLTEIADSL